MVQWLFRRRVEGFSLLSKYRHGFAYQQKRNLVNIKLKWIQDNELDAVVSAEKDLRAASILVSVISSAPKCRLPIYHIRRHRGQLGLPYDLKLSTFIRRYPSVFSESFSLDSAGTRFPCFFLTHEAIELYQEEINVLQQNQMDLLNRLCKLLMLTKDWTLPLQTIDQLKWDMGLPYDYPNSIIPLHHDLFSFVRLSDRRVGLKLLNWDDDLAVSQLQKNAIFQQTQEDLENGCLSFPIGFTRGFGLKTKCMDWLKEWQKLPYTSPYCDPSHLDPRTDVSEKRVVGVFHELLHLTIQKKTERKNVSNLRKPLALPQKFTKVFERHPAIFYISKKCDTQTVILREAYNGQKLLQKHPIEEIRERFASLLTKGFLDRSRGLYKNGCGGLKECQSEGGHSDTRFSSDESDNKLLSDYDSDDSIHDPC